MSKFYITTPIYYVNAQPHIGHAYTTLAADVISRWHKQKGDEVFFLTGTDEHGAKVAEAAQAAGQSPQIFTDEIAGLFRQAWQNLGILYSDFIRTTESRHEAGAAEFLNLLKQRGAVYEGEYRGLYCTGCEDFITEKELVNGLCPDHKKAPEVVAEKNWFFKLADYLPRVKKLIESGELKINPDSARQEALGLIKQDLKDFSVSREKVQWGIKLPWDQSQTIYVWVEALLNYITARGYPKLSKDAWPADLQLIGKDILKFHAIYWPAMLLAAGLETPKELFVHGYFTIDGQKMSKTLGNVIDPNDLVKQYGVDAARYLLLAQFPFGQDGDIKAEKFTAQYNSYLANGLGNLVSRISNLIASNFAGQVKINPDEHESAISDFDNLLANYQLYEALKFLFLRIGELDKRIDQAKPWELVKADKTKAGEFLADIAGEIISIAKCLQPFLPATAEKIIKQFTSGKITKTESLFPRQ